MAKRASLVCQHLEHISRKALENYQQIIRRYVRNREGVYALYKRGRLYYVGLASDLQWRLKHHLRDRHEKAWDTFSVYLTIGDKHLKELESLLLRVIAPRPEGNNQSGRFANSENLRRKFKRDIKAQQGEELELLIGGKSGLRGKIRIRFAEPTSGIELAKYMTGKGSFPIKAMYKGKTLKGRVRQDGRIRFSGKLYNSPSGAGRMAVGRACNGWVFWKFERAPGDWVSLNKLKH
jgi:Restriction Enzyme Adenine Methylase Associated